MRGAISWKICQTKPHNSRATAEEAEGTREVGGWASHRHLVALLAAGEQLPHPLVQAGVGFPRAGFKVLT